MAQYIIRQINPDTRNIEYFNGFNIRGAPDWKSKQDEAIQVVVYYSYDSAYEVIRTLAHRNDSIHSHEIIIP